MSSSSCCSESAGGSSSMARVWMAVRSRPMVTAARTPCPATSPTTSATRPPGQRDGLVPVAADLDELAAGQVAVPDLDRGGIGQAGRQHAPLQGQRGGVLPAVPAGVVDEDGGAGREVHADLDVVRVEPAEPLLPGAGEEAQHGAARDQRQQQHGGTRQQLGHGLAPPGLGDLARLALADRSSRARARRCPCTGSTACGSGNAGSRRSGRPPPRRDPSCRGAARSGAAAANRRARAKGARRRRSGSRAAAGRPRCRSAARARPAGRGPRRRCRACRRSW